MTHYSVTFTHFRSGRPVRVTLVGRLAQTLIALVEASRDGVSALEVSSWALRLAAYIHKLRTIYGLSIETRMEPHDGGEHARYILRSTVRIDHQEPNN